MSQNDVFSALNIGSGMNTTELIQNLLTAERAPKEKKINDKIEKIQKEAEDQDKKEHEETDDGQIMIMSERDAGDDVGDMGKRKGIAIPESLMS